VPQKGRLLDQMRGLRWGETHSLILRPAAQAIREDQPSAGSQPPCVVVEELLPGSRVKITEKAAGQNQPKSGS
jgi:hypothetical protein